MSSVIFADFTHLPTRCGFIAFIPQWDFLDFLADQAKPYPGFKLMLLAEVDDLLWDGDRVVGTESQARRTDRSTSAPISWLAPTAGTRSCARWPA